MDHHAIMQGRAGQTAGNLAPAGKNALAARMGMHRLTRLTNACLKNGRKLRPFRRDPYDALQLRPHNFVRIHQTLRCTPAMAAGVMRKLWELADLVKVLEDWEAGRSIT